jgi:hypothetical protein
MRTTVARFDCWCRGLNHWPRKISKINATHERPTLTTQKSCLSRGPWWPMRRSTHAAAASSVDGGTHLQHFRSNRSSITEARRKQLADARAHQCADVGREARGRGRRGKRRSEHGIDCRYVVSHSVLQGRMLEACCTSYIVHFRAATEESNRVAPWLRMRQAEMRKQAARQACLAQTAADPNSGKAMRRAVQGRALPQLVALVIQRAPSIMYALHRRMGISRCYLLSHAASNGILRRRRLVVPFFFVLACAGHSRAACAGHSSAHLFR